MQHVHVPLIGWTFLGGAIAAEVASTSLLPSTHQFTRPAPVVAVVVGYVVSFYLLSRALKFVPLSVTYAVWSAIGTAAIAVISVLAFGERMSLLKILGLALIVGGVVVVNLA
jgi:small multidrug resistance pump